MAKRILVIEDNPASLELMLYLLKAFGHTPLAARDGVEGVEVARREQPDLILCDVQLPRMNGMEFCRELKDDPALRSVPLVAVNAYAMVGDREKLLAEGFNGYISKPINPETFLEQIKPFMQPATPVKTFPDVLSEPPPAQARRATILVVDNTLANIELARSVFQPFGYEIIAARTADEALALARERAPDLIMSDLHMPEKNGFDLIQEIKADTRLSSIPFVFISSTVWGERERVIGLTLGANRFLIRPIETEMLLQEIESCLSETSRKQQSHEVGGS